MTANTHGAEFADVLTATAPERIWLQVDADGDADDRSEPFPNNGEQTWCAESVGGQEVAYIRADLATDPRLELAVAKEQIVSLESDLSAMRERVEAAEKDAARYRWLRTCKADNNGTPFIARYEGGYISQWTVEPADAAIDSAIAATQEKSDA